MTLADLVVIEVSENATVRWKGRIWPEGSILSVPENLAHLLAREGRADIVGPD